MEYSEYFNLFVRIEKVELAESSAVLLILGPELLWILSDLIIIPSGVVMLKLRVKIECSVILR